MNAYNFLHLTLPSRKKAEGTLIKENNIDVSLLNVTN